jgi:hypothetical protein
MNQQQAYDYNRSGESNKNGRQLEAMAQQAMPQLGSMFGMPPQQAQQMWNQEAKNRAAPAAPVRPVAPKPAPAPVRRNTF